MSAFLEYVPGESPLHRMNPVAKLGAAALFAVACFCTSSLVFLMALLAAGLALAAMCGMVRQTLGLVRAVLAFSLILAVVQLLTTPAGVQLVQLPWGYIGTGSLLAALTTIVRLAAAAIPLFLVFYVTKTNDLANAAVKVLHVPYNRYTYSTSTVHFIPVFMNDMKGVMEAQTARGVGVRPRRHRAESAAHGAVVRAASGGRRCARPTAPPSPPRCAASTCARLRAATRSTRCGCWDATALAGGACWWRWPWRWDRRRARGCSVR